MDDLISRQAAIVQLSHNKNGYDDCDVIVQKDIETIKDLPSVKTTAKTGHWIDADGDNAICSCCNRLNHLYGTYCKHCGAKNTGKSEKWVNLAEELIPIMDEEEGEDNV